MDRRQFLGMAAKGAAGVAATAGLAACQPGVLPAAQVQQAVAENPSLPTIDWQMATSWPPSLDTIFGTAQYLGDRVTALTGGKFKITARAAGELAPGLEVLNVVEQGAVPIGHTASYYYLGKSPVAAFGTTLPFGLTARQQNAWLYDGGGLALIQEAYKAKFGVIQFPAGNTGVQMGGWFNKEIASLADLQGLKMRIPGLGGQTMSKLGVNVQVLAAGEIFQALQTGAIDAAEWVGPYDDEKLGFHKAAKFYYYPGWWEPGPSLEIDVNLAEYEKLPEEYRAALQTASAESNSMMLARYDARNPVALNKLVSESEISVLPFPDDVMQAAEASAFEIFDGFSAADTDFGSIFKEWKTFRDTIQPWHRMGELAMLSYVAQQ